MVEKPPQDNVIVRDGSFGYRVLCVNAPMATDPNIFSQYPIWQLTTAYPMGARVIDNWTWWVALTYTSAGDRPGVSPKWRPDGDFNLGTTQILHELRLAFFWPQLPNGSLGPGHQSFRTLVAGQVAQIGANSPWLYFYQPQSFDNVTNAP